MTAFKPIRARAEKRKGGADRLRALLPEVPKRETLLKLKDDRVLAEMAKRVFSAGFSWGVIEAKWPGFEAAFLGFDPARLAFEPDDFWDALAKDTRIVRYPAKILSVRKNALFVQGIAKERGSFGRLLAEWPADDEAGLLQLFIKRGDRLGGNSGQMLLRFLGWDAFVVTKDVVACLRDAGLDIAETPTLKRDLSKVQEQFNAWAKETGLPYRHLSLICAMSVGENVAKDTLGERASENGVKKPNRRVRYED